MVGINDINPFSSFDIGVGAIGNALILIVILALIIGFVGWLVWWWANKKAYKFKIPLYKSINGSNYKQANYLAKSVPISKAGDCLWFVKGIKKFLAPATLTDAPNSYPHEEREDGEWINFSIDSVNDQQKKAGVKFIHQDMRTQRVATSDILENRLINKGFWEKYKDMIVHLIFYIVVTMLMIVTFWQWGNIVEKIGGLLGQLKSIMETLKGVVCVGVSDKGIVPALVSFVLWRVRK